MLTFASMLMMASDADPSSSHDTSGARPLEGYTIKRGIGAGGFGDVYYATSDAGKEVALKRIQRNLDIELRGVRQCLNLKHVNLLSLYDIRYDSDDQAWVVMEYVGGESLRDVIERNPNGMAGRSGNRVVRGNRQRRCPPSRPRHCAP